MSILVELRKMLPDTNWEAEPTSKGLVMQRRVAGVWETRAPTADEEREFLEASGW